jgi:hypothetical protein
LVKNRIYIQNPRLRVNERYRLLTTTDVVFPAHNSAMPMKRSAKLGVSSALLLTSIFIPPYANWREPLNFASAGLSCVLGLLAAQQGSRWWLTIPCLITVGLVLGLYVGAHAF